MMILDVINELYISGKNTPFSVMHSSLRKLRSLSLFKLQSATGIKLRYRARAPIFLPTFAAYRRIFAWPTSSYRTTVKLQWDSTG